jgi:hypothetical protein
MRGVKLKTIIKEWGVSKRKRSNGVNVLIKGMVGSMWK